MHLTHKIQHLRTVKQRNIIVFSSGEILNLSLVRLFSLETITVDGMG